MRYICVIFCLILIINFHCAKKVYKRNVLDSYQTDNTTKNSSRKTRDVCNLDRPPTPNFRRPERRVSETKCLEYIWDKIIRVKLNFNECDKEVREKKPYSTIGGENALLEEFSHMGGLGYRTLQETWDFYCGCTLISEKYTLTAAHCTRYLRNRNLANESPEIVRFGDKILIDVYSNGTRPNDYKILSIITHPMYKPPRKDNDIALVKIETITRFTNNLQPACLWGNLDTSQLSTPAMSASWRPVETETNTSSHLIQFTVEADIIDSDQCNNLLQSHCNRNWCKVQEHQLCAGKWEYRDIGGPLQAKIPLNYAAEGSLHYIIGIGAFGFFGSPLPTVYTRVFSFIDWIESIVWADN